MKKILFIISVITLFSACQKDFSVWKEYNEAEFKRYIDSLENLPNCELLKSGLLVEVFHKGQTGIVPKLTSDVACSGIGLLVDNKPFATFEPNQPMSVGGARKGLQEILCQMPMGSHFKIYVPYELGYGKEGEKFNTFHIPPYSTLIYDIEIVEVYQNTPK